jgi:hypothetical protein
MTIFNAFVEVILNSSYHIHEWDSINDEIDEECELFYQYKGDITTKWNKNLEYFV